MTRSYNLLVKSFPLIIRFFEKIDQMVMVEYFSLALILLTVVKLLLQALVSVLSVELSSLIVKY